MAHVTYDTKNAPHQKSPNRRMQIIGMSATCVCGSDLWPYRGVSLNSEPTPMGHEYCGIVQEVGSAVRSIKPGPFVVGSFAGSDNTCPNCKPVTGDDLVDEVVRLIAESKVVI